MSYKDGAGLIVVRDFFDGQKFLILLNYDGTWDLPKGGMEPDEPPFECAIRETFEETSIDDLSFDWGVDPISSDNLSFYIARSHQDPVIKMNPVYGNYEHIQGVWVSPIIAVELLPDFLKTFAVSAIDRLQQTIV